jgi:hypothetical protein
MKSQPKILLSILFVHFILSGNAQTNVDALRFSGNSITGTARFSAMSGAFGALGGDFSSLSYNPAGIAIFRKSEFTFTPSIYVGSTSSTFLGKEFDERKYNFNFGNIGLIYTRLLSENTTSSGWKSWNFGIGYNRLNNFHNRSYYEGTNMDNSFLDDFAENATGTNPDDLNPFYESLAYNAWLINPDSNNVYTSVIPAGNVNQQRISETKGSIGETVFTFGANYSNKFYFGATLGFKSLRYVQSTTYEESDPDTQIMNFKNFQFQEDLTTRGTGFDFKVGMIYRANDMVRLGIAFTTPTWYTMHDEYNTRLSSNIDTASYNFEADGVNDYELTTPFKAMGSIAFIFGTYGLFSADYEFSDYGESRFSQSGYSFSDENNIIRDKYIEVHTLRAGTEWLYENLSMRLGFALSTTPLNTQYKVGSTDFSQKSFSGGIGFRENDLFFDLGYVYTMRDEFFQPYRLNSEEVPGVKNSIVTNNFVITMGVKF